MFLLRSMLCLSLVYVAILRGGLPWTSHADERPGSLSLATTRDRAATGLMALCRHRPTQCLAMLALASHAGTTAIAGETHRLGRTNMVDAPKGAEHGDGPEPRRQRPALRLTTTP